MVAMTQRGQKTNTSKRPDRNTLKIYWYLCMQPNGKAGLRQVQRAMGFSSPNAAIFHLQKLQEMQLVQHYPNGDYAIQQKTAYGDMKAFIQVRHYFIPKHAIYAATMTCIMCLCTLLLLPVFSPPVLLALLPGMMAVGILWYEAYIVWQRLPHYQPQET
jgi:hypothetical protein